MIILLDQTRCQFYHHRCSLTSMCAGRPMELFQGGDWCGPVTSDKYMLSKSTLKLVVSEGTNESTLISLSCFFSVHTSWRIKRIIIY